MKTLLTIAFLGNLIDTLATLHLLQWPVIFVTVKMVLMSTVLLWIWKRRGDRNASVAS